MNCNLAYVLFASCWLTAGAFHFAFLLPLGLIMVVNIIMFVLVVKGITCDRPKGLQSTQNKGELTKLQVQTAIGCFIVMGRYMTRLAARCFVMCIFVGMRSWQIHISQHI